MKRKILQIIIVILIQLSSRDSNAQLANWTAVKPDFFPTNVSGQIHGLTRVSQMKFHPTNPNKFYAISSRGGLFVSNNAGANWAVTPGTDFMPYARLASVCVDHTNDQVLYLGTGDHNYYYTGSGIWKSTNGGNTFTYLGLTGRLIVDIIMDPLDNQKLVTITDAGIYKSTNAGSTWVLKSSNFLGDAILQKTPTSRVLYACSRGSEFYRSDDFGDTWVQITSGIVLPSGITSGNGCRIAVTPADTNVVYLGMVANGGTIYKSTNGGTSFNSQKITASPYLTYYSNDPTSSGQGDYNFAIGVDRVNANILYLVAHNNWKSTDGGLTWTQLTNWWQKCHTDMHQIVTNPYNNNQLYNMNDGGVFLSTDGGNNWTPKSDGMNGYEIYHGNCSPTRKDMISIGTQDNGELYSTTAGWFTNRGGDWGSQCSFDYRANSSMVYYHQNNKRRLVSGSDATYGLPAQATLLHDIAFHRSNPNLAFVADSFIYRTTNLTNTTPTWTQIASTGQVIKAMHVAFGDPNILYVITGDSKFHVSLNALSATPTFTTYTLPSTTSSRASITSIKSAPGIIYITANNKVYKSLDFGATWTNNTYNLPSVNHVRVLADEYFSTSQLVFIASNNTVYYKTGAATSWTIYSSNLPSRTEAIDLSIFNDSTSNTSLRYACYGRSVWETPISNLRDVIANFTADNTNPCLGSPVTFSDLSTGNITSRTWSFPGGSPSSSTSLSPVVTYANPGVYNVTLTVSNGISSSTFTQSNFINTNGSTLPFTEGFEGALNPPSGWLNLDNGVSGVAWAKIGTVGGYGNSTSSMFFNNYAWNNPGEKDQLQLPIVSLVGVPAAKLYFDVAYQVFTGYADTLSVLISTDCGNTFTSLYNKGGTVLSTSANTSTNFVPTSSEWRTDTINLSAYAGQSVIIQFQNRNGYGNNLYLDNINIIQAISCTTPLIGGSIAGNTTMNSGVASTFTLSGNTGNSIHWETSTNGGITWNTYAGATSNTASISLTPGTYQLRAVSDLIGSTCVSAYSNVLTLTVNSVLGDVFSNPILITTPYTQTISNGVGSGFTNAYTGANAQASADIFFRFTTGPCSDSLKVSTCGSAFDTYTHLLDASGTQIVGNDDNGPYCTGTESSLKTNITPNTVYYLVVEGYGSNTGNIVVNIEEIDNPILTATASNVSGCAGSPITLIGTPAGGTYSVANPYTGPSTTYTYTYTNANGCSATSSPATITVNACASIVNLKLWIEGYYINGGSMKPVKMNEGVGTSTTEVDEIQVLLADPLSTPTPNAIVASLYTILNTDGTAQCVFPSLNGNYYIGVKHRNTVETWSATPVAIGANPVTYNFTDMVTKAYGNNMVNMEPSQWAFYTGDMFNDGIIDNADFTIWEVDASNFSFGYLDSDLNGDGIIDNADFTYWEANANAFVGKIVP